MKLANVYLTHTANRAALDMPEFSCYIVVKAVKPNFGLTAHIKLNYFMPFSTLHKLRDIPQEAFNSLSHQQLYIVFNRANSRYAKVFNQYLGNIFRQECGQGWP